MAQLALLLLLLLHVLLSFEQPGQCLTCSFSLSITLAQLLTRSSCGCVAKWMWLRLMRSKLPLAWIASQLQQPQTARQHMFRHRHVSIDSAGA
jgi:hypothetical protein